MRLWLHSRIEILRSMIPTLFSIFSALILLFFGARLYAMTNELGSGPFTTELRLPLLRGFLSDILSAAVLTPICSVIAIPFRKSSALIGTVFFIASFVVTCNEEQIHVNFANANFFYAEDGFTPELLRGSIFNTSILGKFAACLVLGGLSYIALSFIFRLLHFATGMSHWLTTRRASAAAFVVLVGVGAGLSRLPLSIDTPRWIAANFLEENLRQFLRVNVQPVEKARTAASLPPAQAAKFQADRSLGSHFP